MLTTLCPELHLKAVTPSTASKIPTLQALQECTVFHFAGHGHVNPKDPAQSLLLLRDWQTNPLTVSDLRELNMHVSAPFLGFLSACSTSANERIRLVDEAIHLAGSLQLAGFRHVVGTLWEVDDECCVDVARTVYETLRDEGMTDAAVCRALHKAVRKVRDRYLSVSGLRRNAELCGDDKAEVKRRPVLSTHWVPYVHYGV